MAEVLLRDLKSFKVKKPRKWEGLCLKERFVFWFMKKYAGPLIEDVKWLFEKVTESEVCEVSLPKSGGTPLATTRGTSTGQGYEGPIDGEYSSTRPTRGSKRSLSDKDTIFPPAKKPKTEEELSREERERWWAEHPTQVAHWDQHFPHPPRDQVYGSDNFLEEDEIGYMYDDEMEHDEDVEDYDVDFGDEKESCSEDGMEDGGEDKLLYDF